VLIVRIDPQTNTVSVDEPTTDTLYYRAKTFTEALGAAAHYLETFKRQLEAEGITNFDLSKE
jgi:hypothetical protein